MAIRTVRKVTIHVLLSVLICLLVGCSPNKVKVGSDAHKSATESQGALGFPELYLDSQAWSITEDQEYIYFAKENGIYRVSKSKRVMQLLYKTKNSSNLIIVNGQMYFISSGKICRINLDGKGFHVLFDSKGRKTETGDMYLNDFQVADDYFVLRSGLDLFYYDLSNNSLRSLHDKSGFVIDANQYQVVDNYVYYIDHADRTGTLYRYDLAKDTTEIIRGKSITMPEDNQIGDFTFVNGDIFYCKYNPNEICHYNSKGADTVMCDYSGTPYVVASLAEYRGKLFYLVFTQSIVYDGGPMGSIKDYRRAQHRIENLGLKQYSLIQFDLANNQTLVVGQFSSLMEPARLQFADGYVFFKTERFKSRTTDETTDETHCIDLSSGEMR